MSCLLLGILFPPSESAGIQPTFSSNHEPLGMERRESRQSHSLTNMDLNLTSETFPVNRRNCGPTITVTLQLFVACRIQFPSQGLNPGPLPWDHRVLATGPPWNSQDYILRFIFFTCLFSAFLTRMNSIWCRNFVFLPLYPAPKHAWHIVRTF